MHPSPHSPPPSPGAPIFGMQPFFLYPAAMNGLFFAGLAAHCLICFIVIYWVYHGQEKTKMENSIPVNEDGTKRKLQKWEKNYVTGKATRRGAQFILGLCGVFYLAYTVTVHNNVLTSEYIKAIADGSTSYLNEKSMGSWFTFALFATGLPIAFSFSLYGSIMMHRALSNAPAEKGFECETIAIWKYAVMMASNRLIISVFFCIALVICYDIRLYSYSLLVGSTMLTITYALDIIQHVAYVGFDCTVSLLARVGIFVGWLVYWITVTQSFGARFHPFGHIKDERVFQWGLAKGGDGEYGALFYTRLGACIILILSYFIPALMGSDEKNLTSEKYRSKENMPKGYMGNLSVGAKGSKEATNALLQSAA
tara:strand:- start:1656 stop:2756 length:1101 start_codon:yes stop_codon:yes gene_type:complete